MLAYLFTLGFFGRRVNAPQITTDRLAFAARGPRVGSPLTAVRAGRVLNPYRAGKPLAADARQGRLLTPARRGKLKEIM